MFEVWHVRFVSAADEAAVWALGYERGEVTLTPTAQEAPEAVGFALLDRDEEAPPL